MADQRPICSSEPVIQRDEPGTVGIRQISTPRGRWPATTLRKRNTDGLRQAVVHYWSAGVFFLKALSSSIWFEMSIKAYISVTS